jgi:ABC-2 type transport system permease protein
MFNLLKKDLKILLSDRKTLALLILMPLINATILGFALAGIFDDGLPFEQLQVAVVKNYNPQVSDLSDKLSDSFYHVIIGEEAMDDMISGHGSLDMEKLFFDDYLGDKDLNKYMDYEIMTFERAESLMVSGGIDGIILLPDNFLEDSQLNFTTIFTNPVLIQVITPVDDGMKGMVLESILRGFVDELINRHSVKNIVLSLAINGENNVTTKDIEALTEKNSEINYNFETSSLEGKKLISAKSYYSAAMLSMFLLFSAGYGSKLLLKERNTFTYQRQDIAGVSFKYIVMSKTVTVFLLVLLQSVTMLTVTHFIFDIIWGDMVSLGAIILSSAFCVAGMGQLLGVITLRKDNFKVASVLESGLFQLFAFFGGSFLPLSALPSVFKPFSYLVVNGLTLRSYLKVLEGQDLTALTLPLGLLLTYGLVFIGISVVLLNKGRRSDYV